MRTRAFAAAAIAARICTALAAAASFLGGAAAADDAAIARGAYVFDAAGCLGCHTVAKTGKPLAGGRRFETPFGTFVSPNITPDPTHGLGGWTEADFIRAMREGRSPDGDAYYPVFPFTSFTGMTDADLRDLWAYLQSVEAVAEPNQPHEVSFPFTTRWPAWGWQLLFFDEAPFAPDAAQSDSWNRGAYLVRHLGHCGECHTARNRLGAMDDSRYMAGNADGPEGEKVPNITPDKKDGIGDWGKIDMTYFLQTGFLPDGDYTGSVMEEVVTNTTSRLSDDDRSAMTEYLLSLPAHGGP